MPTDHKVLLVDDDTNILSGIRRNLRKEKYTILVAENPHQALYIMDEQQVDLVVTDQDMPGIKGTEFLSMLRARHPGVYRIMLTGKGDLKVALKAINEGSVYRFFTKPCRIEDLALAIRQALNEKTLLSTSRELLATVKSQSDVMEKLERETPGITHVDRAEDGAIVVEEMDLDSFMKRAKKQLERL